MGRWSVLALLVGLAVVAVAGYAIGAGKPSQDLVLCAAKKSGDLSLASAKGKCAKGEKKLTVAKEGPVGPVGQQGAPGTDANATLEAVHYVTGSGSVVCAANPATFCRGSETGNHWANFADLGHPGYEKVGFYKEANGTVHLVGTVGYQHGGGENDGFSPPGAFLLPPGFRPAQTKVFKVPSGEGTSLASSATLEVKADGAVVTGGVNAALDGISFRTP
jgi:hypothetical protein